MLVFCFGITRSGSTLAFEPIKGMLESIGHPQERLPDGPVNAQKRMNFIEPVDERRIDLLLSTIG